MIGRHFPQHGSPLGKAFFFHAFRFTALNQIPQQLADQSDVHGGVNARLGNSGGIRRLVFRRIGRDEQPLAVFVLDKEFLKKHDALLHIRKRMV